MAYGRDCVKCYNLAVDALAMGSDDSVTSTKPIHNRLIRAIMPSKSHYIAHRNHADAIRADSTLQGAVKQGRKGKAAEVIAPQLKDVIGIRTFAPFSRVNPDSPFPSPNGYRHPGPPAHAAARLRVRLGGSRGRHTANLGLSWTPGPPAHRHLHGDQSGRV